MNEVSTRRLFLKLSAYCQVTKKSRLVSRLEFVGEYERLKTTNGCNWARRDSIFVKTHKLAIVTQSGTVKYLWNDPSVHETTMMNEAVRAHSGPGGVITGKGETNVLFQICGGQDLKRFNRTIRNDIRKRLTSPDARCVHCGTAVDLEVDHKNDLHNDMRVSNLNTQSLDDFQTLCRHDNQVKREAAKVRDREGVRYRAGRIPGLRALGVDFVSGGLEFDQDDPNALVGSYWYDCEAFYRDARELIRQEALAERKTIDYI